MTRSEMVKEILRLQKEVGIERGADYYFCFSNIKLKLIMSSFQDEIENKEDNQDYRCIEELENAKRKNNR